MTALTVAAIIAVSAIYAPVRCDNVTSTAPATLPAATASSGLGQIKGTVYDYKSGKPLKGALVEIFAATDTQLIDSTSADKHGAYKFSAEKPGSYFLRVSARNRGSIAIPLNVTAGQIVSQDFTLAERSPVIVMPHLRNTVIDFDVATDGKVRFARIAVSSGNNDLDAVAVNAVYQSRWKPARQGGTPVASHFTHTFVID